MKDPDSEAQIPLPCIAPDSGAQIIQLPARPKNLAKAWPSKTATNEANAKPIAKRSRSKNLWYALYFPQLRELDSTQQKKYLDQLAGHMQSVSSTVRLPPQALITEIRISVKYFSGIDVIHQK